MVAAEGNSSTSLFDMQQRAGTDSHPLANLAGAMRRAYFTVSPQHDTTSSALAYCLHYLTVLQTSPDRFVSTKLWFLSTDPRLSSQTARLTHNLAFLMLCMARSSTICNDPFQIQGSAASAMSHITEPTVAAVALLLTAHRFITEHSSGSEIELNAL